MNQQMQASIHRIKPAPLPLSQDRAINILVLYVTPLVALMLVDEFTRDFIENRAMSEYTEADIMAWLREKGALDR
jgi:hypothetical protein